MRQYSMTPQQRSLLAFITARIRQTGVAPTYREMGTQLGLASTSGVHRLVTALEERGQIVRIAKGVRAIGLPALVDGAGLPPDVATNLARIAQVRGLSVENALRRAVDLYARSAA